MNKIHCIKGLRALTGWGLADAKNFTEGSFKPYGVPFLLRKCVCSVEADKCKIKASAAEYSPANLKLVILPEDTPYKGDPDLHWRQNYRYS